MIVEKNIEAVWRKHKKQLLKLHAAELVKKVGAKDLEYRYTDLNGVNYFAYGRDMSLPVNRLGKLYSFTELLYKGFTADEDEAIDKAISQQLELGLTNSKEKVAAKIGSLLMEREKRRRIVIHGELILNIICVQWIREDEEPTVFNNEIHMQKVEQFKLEVENGGAYPFFLQPELRQLSSSLQLSKEELEQRWQESLTQQQVLSEALKSVYISEQDSGKLKKIFSAV